jgi:3',5'-nucleoside bisphosphate phosphatase
MRTFCLLAFTCLTLTTLAQTPHSHSLGRVVKFPDVPGYKSVKCDFHMHTVFSDGSVWPDIRVQEALMDGLDAISLTEHLEYQPHQSDIPHPDRNRSYELALNEAKDHNLLIIRGSEITRSMPPGHNNAIFISDANKMLVSDSVGVFREAKRQGAFTFWNHPNWTAQRPDGMATLTPMHKLLIKEKLLDGIEVVNDQTYSDEALQIALDNNLTIMGTSDIHGLIDWDFVGAEAQHRPITLVFAKEKTEAGIKEGLMNRRTVAFYKNLLIGRNEFLIPLIQESLVIKTASYQGKSNVLSVVIENRSSATFTLRNKTGFTMHTSHDIITIAPGSDNILQVKTKDRLSATKLTFEILNAVNAPASHPQVTWSVSIQ